MACRGVLIFTRLPFILTSPPVTLSAANIARALSLRPDPSRPANPFTSPFCMTKLNGLTPAALERPIPSKTGMEVSVTIGSCFVSFEISWSSLPSIFEISSNWESEAVSYSPTSFPLRSTVTLSLISYTCSRKWVIKMIPTPRSFSSRMRTKSFCTSSSSREDVGSSSMRILQSISTARAIAIICCTAIEQLESSWTGLAGILRDSSSCTAFWFICFQLTNELWLRPMNIFSATVKLGQSMISW